MYTHCGVYVNPDVDTDLVKTAINSMELGSTLDAIVSPPASIEEAEKAAGILYGLAPPRPSDLNFTVYLTAPKNPKWQHTFGEPFSHPEPTSLRKYSTVAVGGTWDHMHWGHRLMLTMAAETCQNRVIIGVTASQLLVHKKYAEALQSYDERTKAAVDFVHTLRPDVAIEPYPLENMYGPTATVEDIQALVVSHETRAGGGKVNEKREELGWNALDIIEVGLIGGGESGKLSSTDLRREHLEKGR